MPPNRVVEFLNVIGDRDYCLTVRLLSQANYDATLSGWNGLPSLQPGVTVEVAGLTYCSSAAARSNIISSYSWSPRVRVRAREVIPSVGSVKKTYRRRN